MKKYNWNDVRDQLPLVSEDVLVKCFGEEVLAYYYNDVWHIDDAPDPDWGVTAWRYLEDGK